MTEPVVPVRAPVPLWLSVANWAKDTAERSVTTFLVGIVAMGGLDQFSDFHADWGKKVAAAGLIAVAAFLKNAALPKAGLGLPVALDIAARAAWSALQAAAVVVLANQALNWFAVSSWQIAGAAALAAAVSALKGAVASRVRPGATITPASLAPAS